MNKEQEKAVLEALITAFQYFEKRDQLNATIHLNLVRHSPLTERVKEAMNIMVKLRTGA